LTTTGSLVTTGRSIGVIGAGVMGQTLIRGLIDAGLAKPAHIWATAKSEETCERVMKDLGIRASQQYRDELATTGLILLCTKPSQARSVLSVVADEGLPADALLISVMAGVTTTQLEAMLGKANPWVRAMPNTPCVVGHGMTVICRGEHAQPAHLDLAEKIFAAVGRCLVVDEAYCNAITALSGSGPAYMYLVMEALADAGVRVGLPRGLALTLVAQTMLGSAKMVLDSNRHPASLRDDVTTPAGCTIGGLLMLEDGKIRSVLARAVEEATRIVDRLGQVSDTKGQRT
jgi:pyrroline-5-carboxylate reductase